jgi:hypothetical protein
MKENRCCPVMMRHMMGPLQLGREGYKDNGYSAIAANRWQTLQQEADKRQQPKEKKRGKKTTTMLPLLPMGGRRRDERQQPTREGEECSKRRGRRDGVGMRGIGMTTSQRMSGSRQEAMA